MATTQQSIGESRGDGRIGIRQAIATARQFVQEIADEPLTNLRLEEVRIGDERDDWLVTLGYDRVTDDPLSALGIPAKRTTRVYRVITVDADTGEPTGMQMRTP